MAKQRCSDDNYFLYPSGLKQLAEKVKLRKKLQNMKFPKNNEGKTTFHLAAEKGKMYIFKHFIDVGVDMGIRDEDNKTLLHLAISNGHKYLAQYLAKLLRDSSADINAKDAQDNTPLHEAAMNNKPDVIALLLDFRADINSLNKYNNTALHAAASRGHKAVVEMLLAHGADLNLLNKGDKTAADLARAAGHADVAKMIEEHAQLLADLEELKHQNVADVANQNAVESMPAPDAEQIDTGEQLPPTDDTVINGLDSPLINNNAHL